MVRLLRIALCLSLVAGFAAATPPTPATQAPGSGARPGSRVVVDAHNCYPYGGRWSDRITRALDAASPIAIEQDLALKTDSRSGAAVTVLSHSRESNSGDPPLRSYFFETLRPRIEQALREGDHGDWPLITLNLDIKSEQPEHLAAIWQVLRQYQDWLTTAPRTADIRTVQPLSVGPILVLAGSSDAQQRVFYDQVPVGGRLLAFGAAHAHHSVPEPANNYRRWSNNSWSEIEEGGPALASPWTPAKARKLEDIVTTAHGLGLWIRFYTLDGASPAEMRCHGWFQHYNFGSLAAATQRWRAAAAAGVDYLASDQYEQLAHTLHPTAAVVFESQTHGSCRSLPLADQLRLDLDRNLRR